MRVDVRPDQTRVDRARRALSQRVAVAMETPSRGFESLQAMQAHLAVREKLDAIDRVGKSSTQRPESQYRGVKQFQEWGIFLPNGARYGRGAYTIRASAEDVTRGTSLIVREL